jgi:hypothetical protein
MTRRRERGGGGIPRESVHRVDLPRINRHLPPKARGARLNAPVRSVRLRRRRFGLNSPFLEHLSK